PSRSSGRRSDDDSPPFYQVLKTDLVFFYETRPRIRDVGETRSSLSDVRTTIDLVLEPGRRPVRTLLPRRAELVARRSVSRHMPRQALFTNSDEIAIRIGARAPNARTGSRRAW